MPDDPGERRWRAEFYPPLVSERREVITSGNPKVIFSVIGGDPGRRRNEQGRKMADLNGKVVLVTGSSRGIGAEIAVAFARQGAKVVLHGRDTEALAKVQADSTHRGGHAMFVTGDVTKFADIEAICARVEQTYGLVDVLVACASSTSAAVLSWCDPLTAKHHGAKRA